MASQVSFSSKILWLFGQKIAATTHSKLRKRTVVGWMEGRRIGKEQVDFDYVCYAVSEDIQMKRSSDGLCLQRKENSCVGCCHEKLFQHNTLCCRAVLILVLRAHVHF